METKEIISGEYGEGFFFNYCQKEYFYYIKLDELLCSKIPQDLKNDYEKVIDCFVNYHCAKYEHFTKYYFNALNNIFNPSFRKRK